MRPDPAVTPFAVTEHEPEEVSVHEELTKPTVPVPPVPENATVPVGLYPDTVVVQLLSPATAKVVGLQETDVNVTVGFTVRENVP
jgi:hypothetical protein